MLDSPLCAAAQPWVSLYNLDASAEVLEYSLGVVPGCLVDGDGAAEREGMHTMRHDGTRRDAIGHGEAQ